MTPPTTLTDSVRALAVSDTGFVFDPRTGHAYTVNATGLLVLRALKEGNELPEIVGKLQSEFRDVTSGEADVREFLALLAEMGLASDAKVH